MDADVLRGRGGLACCGSGDDVSVGGAVRWCGWCGWCGATLSAAAAAAAVEGVGGEMWGLWGCGGDVRSAAVTAAAVAVGVCVAVLGGGRPSAAAAVAAVERGEVARGMLLVS